MSTLHKSVIARLKATAAYNSANFANDLDVLYDAVDKAKGVLNSPEVKKQIEHLDGLYPKANLPTRLKKLQRLRDDLDDTLDEMIETLAETE